MAESQTIRFIEDIAGMNYLDSKNEIKQMKAQLNDISKDSDNNYRTDVLRKIYSRIHELQFCPEYLCLVCESKKDYHRACLGFKVNGMEYHRLLGTSGGIKQSTVVFVSTHTRNGIPLFDELQRRIDNGRNKSLEYIPAKLEAYMALTCSASSPVSSPSGVLVVDDCITHFKDDYVLLEDDPKGGDPIATNVIGGDVELNASDGFGLMSPALSAKWSAELGLDYSAAGFCIRNSFCKGMVYAFDFHEFGRVISGFQTVKDIWGNEVDINNIELILTASMLKLWSAYDSYQSYEENCRYNKYSFSITKATPKTLENERRLNYQFIQSYHLTYDQLWELAEPSIKEVSDVMGEDLNSSLLFLRGSDVTEDNVSLEPYDFVSTLMIDDRMINDPYIRSKIRYLIKKRLTEAKFGKIKVHGNFSTVSGDPFALCQSIWGLPVTGLLKSGQIYNKYWNDRLANELVCFRAPMSSHHNIRKVSLCRNWSVTDWYRYMDTVTILNAWDTICMALNGCDMDGDLVMLTDNSILLNNHMKLPAVNCVQKNGIKKIPCEEDFIESNINGFGDEIGAITNRITSQYDVQAQFDCGSAEWNELEYRIMCGQKYQQETIDRIKGIFANPIPKHWYDRKAAEKEGNAINTKIIADRKPYFMTYRYSAEASALNKFQKNANEACILEFGYELNDILHKEKPTAQEAAFIENYYRRLPVIDGGGVMNRLCHLVEEYFENWNQSTVFPTFDYSIMKSGCEYTTANRKKLEKLYLEYQELQSAIIRRSANERWSNRALINVHALLIDEFKESCMKICPSSRTLCDILLDICYKSSQGKNFVWDICGHQIIENLLQKSNSYYYLQKSKRGNIYFGGSTFIKKRKSIEVNVNVNANSG